MKRGAAVFAALVAMTACAHHTIPPAVPEVVAERASAWTKITVTATGGRSADVPSDLRSSLAPLIASRSLNHPGPAADYGLDRPQAQLTYSGPNDGRVVLVGNIDFDRHFFYVQRQGSPVVYLVPADALRPVLSLVGIKVAAPD